MPTVQCKQCGVSFRRKLYRIHSNGKNFCSHACCGAYLLSLRPKVTCAQCGASLSKKPYRIHLDKPNFCKQACYIAYVACKEGTVREYISNGYRVLRIGATRQLVREHRLIMEQYLGRKLLPKEHVHHLDHNPLNNSLSNLVVLDASAHMREHVPLTWDLERAKAMRAEGSTFEEIGKALGVWGDSIKEVFISRGLYIPKHLHSLKWDLEQAKTMRAQGISFAKIGKALGVHWKSIRNAFTRRGIPLDPKICKQIAE